MINREKMMPWIIDCLKYRGGSGWPKDVAKYVWENHTFNDGTGVAPGAGGDSNTQTAASGDLEINLIDEVLNTSRNLWSTGATLTQNSPYAVEHRGTSLLLREFSDDFGVLSYEFFGTIGLLNFFMDNAFTLEILMSVNGTLWDGENGIMAFIGDPGDLDSTPGFTGSLTQVTTTPGTGGAIPEPATLILFGMGLIGLVGMNRKKN